ncbi:MAG TPA: hypothetical protein VE964_15980, partial [Myxococcales bacterium]|nr:hypothetical protein [Myxococcales bacterium]
MAKLEPRVLFFGTDAIADNLRDASRRASENSLFGLLALEDAPGELAGLADRLTVLFPWGSLLRALALAEPVPVARLRGLCKPGADVRFVLELGDGARDLEGRYFAAGFELEARRLPVEA